MPKSTFYNLSDEKRQRVLEAAIDEFASNSYHKASITRIVEKADIAKGSFYQYFENKMDLFKYIIDMIGKKKLQYLDNVIRNIDKYNFFQLLREVYVGGIRFARDNPRLVAIGNELVNNNKSVFKEVMGDQKPKSICFFKNILEQGINKGEVDDKIDSYLVAHMLTQINFSLAELIYEDEKVDSDDIKIIDNMLYVLENGLKNRQTKGGE